MKNIQVLLFFLSFIDSLSSEIISAEYMNLFGTSDILLNIGTPPRVVHLELNMETQFTWVSFFQFTPGDSSTTCFGKNESIIINKKEVVCQNLKDVIKFQNSQEKLNNFSFYYTSFGVRLSSNCIGLAYKFNDEQYSIVHQLYNKGIIPSKSFGFINKTIYFGGLPIDKNNYSFIGKCNVQDNKSSWGCKLESLEIDGKFSYMSINTLSFQSSHEKIYAPSNGYQYLVEHVFSQYLANNSCSNSSYGGSIQIICNCKRIKYFPVISFKIAKFYLHLDKSLLFYQNFHSCIFNIELNRNDQVTWILGGDVFKKYATLFDYHNKSISFYTNLNNHISNNKTSSFIHKKDVFMISFFILTFGVIFLIIIQFIQRKMENKIIS